MYSPVTVKALPVVNFFAISLTIGDRSSYYKNMTELLLYECNDTKMCFFYPLLHWQGIGLFMLLWKIAKPITVTGNENMMKLSK